MLTIPNLEALAQVLRDARKRWTQTELARRAGCSKSMISELETAKARMRLDRVLDVMGALDLQLHVDQRPHPRAPGRSEAVARRKRRRLRVAMNGLWVGTPAEVQNRALEFAYDDSWLASAGPVPLSLSIPLGDTARRDAVVEHGFDNLLPDDRSMRERMRSTVGAASTRAVDLLAEVGRDCIGAIQLVDEDETDVPDVRRIDAEPLSDSQVEALLASLPRRTHGMLPDRSDFRISVAGAQGKTALLQRDGRWHLPLGATPTTHILKPAIGRLPSGLYLAESVEDEWLCSRVLRPWTAGGRIANRGLRRTAGARGHAFRPRAVQGWMLDRPTAPGGPAAGPGPAA
ncbi:HipA N-terminal domain-containing protein [Engelhardtia mirabilis]|uniref:Serine/threonine-protein kinase HipA n=1 Tax=Engelhardtia mirabilis TaxID=2528011 RepID=A0A518BEB9_9BACT|nr:Serine/threonine-protein kinase HipA [Planctomycetes bacterium Pla133]QDU99628.1 Serine/threonine-protein kinase HipA [Planctomycetes bacterium Pla86]